MDNPLSIAIIGCGTAGLAAAAFLARDGHKVTLFEQFQKASPIGAGLLLQPTGLACLSSLGLRQKAIENGAVINHLYGRTVAGHEIFDVSYKDLKPDYFGVGIHRGTLFQMLYGLVQDLSIPIVTSCPITKTQMLKGKREMLSQNGQNYGPFDLVIDASGRNSPLRPTSLEVLNRKYPFGAIWGVLDDPEQAFGQDYLQQRYDAANTMAGMLAIGKAPKDTIDKCTFFWSLPPGGYQQWMQLDLSQWKAQVTRCWPELEPLLIQFEAHEQLIFAQYGDVAMRQWHQDRLVFIGDAGHNSSPQLGQGANLALCDALILSRQIRQYNDINLALAYYSAERKSHIRFYQLASRWLTPFFQSDSKFHSHIRDSSFPLMKKIPWLHKEMLKTLAGIKTGPFREIDLHNLN